MNINKMTIIEILDKLKNDCNLTDSELFDLRTKRQMVNLYYDLLKAQQSFNIIYKLNKNNK